MLFIKDRDAGTGHDWFPLGPYPLGGYRVALGQRRPSQDTYETVLTNDFPRNTALVRFDSGVTGTDPPSLADFNFTSGLGGASLMQGNNTSGAFLIMPAGDLNGPVRFIRNDRARHDHDGDGLGDSLEADLCTASAPGDNNTRCGIVTAFDPRDTDGDGIPDYWELLGCAGQPRPDLPAQAHCPNAATGGQAQLLPAWGANPRHMDVFLEADRVCDNTVPIPNCDVDPQGGLAAWATALANGPADHLGNPDGRPGISIHVDVGPVPAPRCAALIAPGVWPPRRLPPTTCGDWGGSDLVPRNVYYNGVKGQDSNPSWTADQLTAAGDPYFGLQRRGIFHYSVFSLAGKASTGFDASDFGHTHDYGGWHSGFEGSFIDFNFLNMHEFGHAQGLGHGGADDFNCKPHYDSMMNYASRWAHYLSDGKFSNLHLNPYDLDWYVDLGPNAAALFPDFKALMEQADRDWEVAPALLPGSSYAEIDWNRNGIRDAGRAFLSDELADGGGCDNWYRRDDLPDVQTEYRVAMERLNPQHLYVFYNLSGKLAAYRTSTSDFATCGKPNHLDGCGNWEPFRIGPSGGLPLAGGPAATFIPASLYHSDRVLLVLRQGDGSIRAYTMLPSTTIQGPELVASAGSSFGEVAAVAWGALVHVLYQAPDGTLRHAQRAVEGGPWTTTTVTVNGITFKDGCYAGPSLTAGYLAGDHVVYGLFTDDNCSPEVYRYNETQGTWIPENFFGGVQHLSFFSPAIGWISNGQDPKGRLFVWYNRGELLPVAIDPQVPFTIHYAYRTHPSPNGAVMRDGFVGNWWSEGPDGIGVTLYYDARSVRPALRGVTAAADKDTQGNTVGHHMQVWPYADGTIDWDLRDYSDWKLLRVGICRSLRGCGVTGTEPGAMCPGRCSVMWGHARTDDDPSP
ncbi:MAG: hypothetical protein HY828_01400 [Actinobacteria bacterium]|nr:hypothetical protein [Actinomycetota bacterium]